MSEEFNRYLISYREVYGKDLHIYAKSSEDAMEIFERLQDNITLVGHDDFLHSYTGTEQTEAGEFDEKEIKTENSVNGISIMAKYDENNKLLALSTIKPIVDNVDDRL